jgi:ParB family chromosome partitioning protein
MTTIPLNKLTSYSGNVRKTGVQDGLEELTASIAAHGLLQSLVVRKSSRGKFSVIAGQRRLLALSALAERKQVAADLPVECHIVDGDADALEIGLAENVVRRPMHPADQFEAFRALIDNGSSVADVAARFGVSDAIVTKRLRLGRVSPALLQAYRNGELSLEQIQAFTVSDDHAHQEQVWAGLSPYNCNPTSIREALTEGEVPATDKRVRFIGLDAYEAAGGTVRRDLFDDRNAGYILDVPLLDHLVQQSLNTAAEEVRAEGWSWVEPRIAFGYDERAEFSRAFAEEVETTEAEECELEALQAERDVLEDQLGEDDDGEGNPDIAARLEAIDARIDVINDRPEHWSPEVMANAGAVVTLSSSGALIVERGLIRPEDAFEPDDAAHSAEDDDPESQIATLPATLIASLTAHKTAALRVSLFHQPNIALAAVTHALARQAFYSSGGETCLEIAVKHRRLATSLKSDTCPALTALESACQVWRKDRLPRDAGELWAWCLVQPQETLLDLLALSAALTLDAVREKGTREDAPRLLHANALADALGCDMKAWFTPTAANYFSRINRTAIMEAMVEAGIPARTRSWSKLKKSELATLAEEQIAGTGWLPHPLRPITGHVQADEAQADMPAAAAA